ncbi:vascular endothelial growth factor A [Poeciliopsis prolifica]|uniref:vascular endothelial growth factor A n=1 Tax=Poeciliopsis prolifica TaxID=188132 RepID=UPI0024139364|nr:vascular endothelial growth factor A [Poeciliopsis prolifica]
MAFHFFPTAWKTGGQRLVLLSGAMYLLLVPLLLIPVQVLNLPGKERPTAMGFTEVLNQSLCRPIEQHVNVNAEFPGGVEDFYIPHCVSLFRCSGCCIDEARECYPVAERNITLEVSRSNQVVNLTFVEHQECGVRLKEHRDNASEEDSLRRRRRRRRQRRRRCAKCQFSVSKTHLP